jgi:hypothetical protein
MSDRFDNRQAKGGQNPPNENTSRPPAPGGSAVSEPLTDIEIADWELNGSYHERRAAETIRALRAERDALKAELEAARSEIERMRKDNEWMREIVED